jgi:pimeloyl-ACP methyl ester carboxylesterase
MPVLAYSRCGSGDPLVLLHGLGSSRSAWQPVIPILAEHFDVIAVDLPGFGGSERLPTGVEPSPAALAAAVADTLTQLGVGAAHIVGNSLGGWVALELAALRPTRSLTAVSPAGLWRRYTPLYCRLSLRASRLMTRSLGGPLRFAVRWRIGRAIVFGQMTGRPSRMTVEQARTAITALGTSSGFRAALHATLHRRYLASGQIRVPVTVAFGTRDRVLLKRQSRHLDQLPRHADVVQLPGVGHVPMSDDPEAVAGVITATALRARSADLAKFAR